MRAAKAARNHRRKGKGNEKGNIFWQGDWNGTGRKINEVTVELELRERGGEKVFTINPATKEREYTGEETPRYLEFAAVGNVWNMHHTDIICGGQCLDELLECVDTPLYKEIHRLWKLYHLNGMHAGTEEQEKAVDELKALGVPYDYTFFCDYLKRRGLYEVEYNGKPYRYGHGWLHRDIPEKDLERIKEIIETGK